MRIYLVLKNEQVVLTEINSEKVLTTIRDRMDDGKSISVGGTIYRGWEINKVMNEENYKKYKAYTEQKEQSKKDMKMSMSGQWKCRYGYWHEPRQECGHDLQYGGRRSTPSDYQEITSVEKLLSKGGDNT